MKNEIKVAKDLMTVAKGLDKSDAKIAKQIVGFVKELVAEEPKTASKEVKASVNPEDVRHVLDRFKNEKQISDEYWGRISEAIFDDVVQDVIETADNENWSDDDVRLAVGRAICKRFGIEF